jgi:hypothetical protein
MDPGMLASRARCATVWAGLSGVGALLVAGLLPVVLEGAHVAAHADLDAASFDSLLVWGCAAAATAVTGWLWLVATLVILDAARGVSDSRRGVPIALRRALLVLCGAALTGSLSSLTAPALADETSGGEDAPARLLAGLRLPERVAVTPAAHQDRAPDPVAEPASRRVDQPAAAPVTTLVVARGDNLWNLAAEQLGAHPSEEETAAAWQAVYALNRELIGPDPDLIRPGQRLVLPATGPEGAAG